MDIWTKLQPESASNMVNSRQRKRMIRMNEMSMERKPLIEELYCVVGVHASEEGPYSLRKLAGKKVW